MSAIPHADLQRLSIRTRVCMALAIDPLSDDDVLIQTADALRLAAVKNQGSDDGFQNWLDMYTKQNEIIQNKNAAILLRVQALEAALERWVGKEHADFHGAGDFRNCDSQVCEEISALLAPPPATQQAQPETPQLSEYAQRQVSSTQPSGLQGKQ